MKLKGDTKFGEESTLTMSELHKIMSNSNHPLNFLNKDLP